MIYLGIAAGSALGALARGALALWLNEGAGGGLPLGTFAANALGAFLIGLLSVILARRAQDDPALRHFLLTGFCGGFTTFSVFSFEAFAMMVAGSTLMGAVLIAVSVLSWLIAVALGHSLGQRLRIGRVG